MIPNEKMQGIASETQQRNRNAKGKKTQKEIRFWCITSKDGNMFAFLIFCSLSLLSGMFYNKTYRQPLMIQFYLILRVVCNYLLKVLFGMFQTFLYSALLRTHIAVDNNGNTLKSGQQLSICHYDALRCTYV